MGKKNKSGVGQSLVKSRSRGSNKHGDSWRHTSELNDAVDWQRLNISSITEQSALDDFLATAQLAGTEFTAEKLNITFVTASHNEGVLSVEDAMHIKQAQEENKTLLRIPRRPQWTTTMSAQELDLKERDGFIAWRRQLAELQEVDHIILTPFEKNIEFWRQLWRVIERSDVVVQIVDARHPLLFRCEDLDAYVKEVNPQKENLLLINKADYLTPFQRSLWAKYFKDKGIAVAFWSALDETDRLEKEKESKGDEENQLQKISEQTKSDDDGDDDDDNFEPTEEGGISVTSRFAELSTEEKELDDEVAKTHNEHERQEIHRDENTSTEPSNAPVKEHSTNSDENKNLQTDTDRIAKRTEEVADESLTNDENEPNLTRNNLDFSGKLLTSDELIELCQYLHHCSTADGNSIAHTTIGMVGYPNVGKSSTINAILQHKKVSVSATPGRTKHFQTLNLGKDVCLCDCPGLVFPSFVSTKAEMVVNGILPIDQMRDHLPPVSLVCQRIPREVLELVYGINIAKPEEGEDPDRPPLAHELLNAYGYMRGFMTSRGTPDGPRSSRYILKDYVKGKLLYCTPPPGVDAVHFQNGRFATGRFADLEEALEKRRVEAGKHATQPQMSSIDADFFAKKEVRHFVKGAPVMLPGQSAEMTSEGMVYKPWKKHNNKNKREKLRRLEKKIH